MISEAESGYLKGNSNKYAKKSPLVLQGFLISQICARGLSTLFYKKTGQHYGEAVARHLRTEGNCNRGSGCGLLSIQSEKQLRTQGKSAGKTFAGCPGVVPGVKLPGRLRRITRAK